MVQVLRVRTGSGKLQHRYDKTFHLEPEKPGVHASVMDLQDDAQDVPWPDSPGIATFTLAMAADCLSGLWKVDLSGQLSTCESSKATGGSGSGNKTVNCHLC